ncbi:MAG: transcription-repair coupling factor [Eubacterium sp.]|nr:transcription-repair coupling factor [Eubacterium sp.]
MTNDAILEPLRENEEFERLAKDLSSGISPIGVTGITDTPRSQFVAALADKADFRLIITYDEMRAAEIVSDMKMYDPDVMLYPAKDLIFYSADVHGRTITGERLSVIRRLQLLMPTTIVTTIDGGMDACLPYTSFKKHELVISISDVMDLEAISVRLSEMGYDRVSQVENEGEFSIRGGIMDIFPETEDTAYRIELFDDEIESIRCMDTESQRSFDSVESIHITPATEVMLTPDMARAGLHAIRQEAMERIAEFKKTGQGDAAERLRHSVETFCTNFEIYKGMVNIESYIRYFSDDEPVSFFNYFEDKSVLVFIDEPVRVMDRARAVEEEFRESMSSRLNKGYILSGQADILYRTDSVVEILKKYPMVVMSSVLGSEGSFGIRSNYSLHVVPGISYNSDISALISQLKKYINKKYRILIITASGTRGTRMCESLMEYNIESYYSESMDKNILPGEIMIARGSLRHGFEYPDQKFVVLTENDIYGARRKKKKKKRYEGASIHSFNELHVGDYVVHENHGLGIYEGIESIEKNHVSKDYLKVSYAGGSNLYVPATSLEVLQKYASSDAKPPKLNRLGGSEWEKTKTKVRGAVEEVAAELVELYAKRRNNNGHAVLEDTVWQKEFEELFQYEETDDQLHAIEDVKRDMESNKIMDRLICGDVGYGKTEIALRAAFKAVMDGRQVAVLVPTTILASQHYSTFSERMKSFGVNVELMCRLRTPAQIRKTIQGLKNGSVDVVVGTHKLLGKNVEFKKLGLLIIDEEQRFGVKHKEKIKLIKDTVDVLTLTATPIPRTLHMSLIGVRDMSVLEEPPEDRQPIQTFVMERSDEIAREAILREIARGGQVYYIYNRVNNIDYIAGSLKKLIPEANIAYAHGQMPERELEDVMYSFIEGDIDVLVATTIVESGLDIPNVNTIIVEDADRLGLSQLYQLRGRVGRSGRAAYAFLMYKREKILAEVAEKRLAAIKEFTDLGSGFRISMKDLELRGAGNILGTGQSGHMAAVGYDLYCKLLDQAIARLKGEDTSGAEYETSIDIRASAYIPVSYIRNEFQKLDIYKRIAEIENEEEASDMREELKDRFGELPESAENLLSVTLIKARAHRAYVTALEEKDGELVAQMYMQAKIDPVRIPGIIRKTEGKIIFEPERKVLIRGVETLRPPMFRCRLEGDSLSEAAWMIEKLETLVEE